MARCAGDGRALQVAGAPLQCHRLKAGKLFFQVSLLASALSNLFVTLAAEGFDSARGGGRQPLHGRARSGRGLRRLGGDVRARGAMAGFTADSQMGRAHVYVRVVAYQIGGVAAQARRHDWRRELDSGGRGYLVRRSLVGREAPLAFMRIETEPQLRPLVWRAVAKEGIAVIGAAYDVRRRQFTLIDAVGTRKNARAILHRRRVAYVPAGVHEVAALPKHGSFATGANGSKGVFMVSLLVGLEDRCMTVLARGIPRILRGFRDR